MSDDSVRLLMDGGDRHAIILVQGRDRHRLPWTAIRSVRAKRVSFGDGALTCLTIEITDDNGRLHKVMLHELEAGFDETLRALAAALPALPHRESWIASLNAKPQGLQLYPSPD